MCLTSLLALHSPANNLEFSPCTYRPHWASCWSYSRLRKTLTLMWSSDVPSGVFSCCFCCPCVQAALHSVAEYTKHLDCPWFGSTHSPWGWSSVIPHGNSNCCLSGSSVYNTVQGDPAPFSVLNLICRYVRRSWSHTAGSARSSTRWTCSRTFPRAWPRGCCTHAHSTAGCSHRAPPMCGCIPSPESQGFPAFDLLHSNWAICSHTAGLPSGSVFFAGFSLSGVTFFSVCLISVCCFHTYPLKNGLSSQRRTWFSSTSSQRRTQKHRDSGSPLTSALLQPESKWRTFGCGLSLIRNMG